MDMFFALVLACTPIKELGCLVITDTRGPYVTRQECTARTQEIIKDSLVIFRKQRPHIQTNFYNFRYRCDIRKAKVSL